MRISPETIVIALIRSWPRAMATLTLAGGLVACGAGTLLIRRLQLPIGKGSVLSGADILNARTDVVYPGLRFGA